MALLDKTYIKVGLALFALYVIMEMQKGSTEHMDTVVNVTSEGTEVKVGEETVATAPAGAQTTVYVDPSGALAGAEEMQYASAVGPSQIAPQPGAAAAPPAPLTAVSEELYATAPVAGGETVADEAQAFTAQAVDFDELFDRADNLEPADLIPKSDPGGLYSDIKPDPSLDNSLLINAHQIGIETNSGNKRWIADPRPLHYIPQTQVSPWNNPTVVVPSTRKSFADL